MSAELSAIQKMIEAEVERIVASRGDNTAQLDTIKAECERFTDELETAIDGFKSNIAAILGKRKRASTKSTEGGAATPASPASSGATDTDAAILEALANGPLSFKDLGEVLYPNQPFQGGRQRGVRNALGRLIAGSQVIEPSLEVFALVSVSAPVEAAPETVSEGASPTTEEGEGDDGETVTVVLD